MDIVDWQQACLDEEIHPNDQINKIETLCDICQWSCDGNMKGKNYCDRFKIWGFYKAIYDENDNFIVDEQLAERSREKINVAIQLRGQMIFIPETEKVIKKDNKEIKVQMVY
ncbi:MAG: hypothetical protein ACTSR3_01040 [Candidatus Helarchaeota archaeon]